MKENKTEIDQLKAELAAERRSKIESNIRRYYRPESDLRWECARILLSNGHPASVEAGAKMLIDLLPQDAKLQIVLYISPTSKERNK